MFTFLTDFLNPSGETGRLERANTLDLIGTGVQALGSIWGGFASNQSSQVRADILRYNAATYRQSAGEILEVGRFNAQQIKEQARQLIGTQRTALAANGIRLDQDTALDLVSETAGVGAVDALIAIANSEREAIQTMRRATIEDLEAKYESQIGRAQIGRGIGNAALTLTEGLQRIGQRNDDFANSSRATPPIPVRKPTR